MTTVWLYLRSLFCRHVWLTLLNAEAQEIAKRCPKCHLIVMSVERSLDGEAKG